MSLELHINHAYINTAKPVVSFFKVALLFIASAFNETSSRFSTVKSHLLHFVTVEVH
jgi:hypothetical protein